MKKLFKQVLTASLAVLMVCGLFSARAINAQGTGADTSSIVANLEEAIYFLQPTLTKNAEGEFALDFSKLVKSETANVKVPEVYVTMAKNFLAQYSFTEEEVAKINSLIDAAQHSISRNPVFKYTQTIDVCTNDEGATVVNMYDAVKGTLAELSADQNNGDTTLRAELIKLFEEAAAIKGEKITVGNDNAITVVKPEVKPTATPKPTEAPAVPAPVYDDGGPFTTDVCGNVFDRWGNKIYSAPACAVSNGYQVPNTGVWY